MPLFNGLTKGRTPATMMAVRKQIMLKTLAVSTMVMLGAACANATVPNDVSDVVEIPVVPYEPNWKCPGCNTNEQYVLKALQEKTNIVSKNALATIMGNIKSESGFRPNVCEGGAIVPYQQCHYGGYGLIQWTTTARYNGLGKFCKKYGCDPSSLEGQTRYMINEVHFQKVLPEFEGNGQTVAQLMSPSYRWLGWGIKGYRQQYAYQYTKKMVWS